MLRPALLATLAEPVGPRATLEVVISIAALTVGLSLELREEEKPTQVNFSESTSCELRGITHEVPEPACVGLRLNPFYGSASAILLDPVALLVLLVFLLHGASSDTVGAVLLAVLILCGVERLLVDLLCVLGQVVFHVIW